MYVTPAIFKPKNIDIGYHLLGWSALGTSLARSSVLLVASPQLSYSGQQGTRPLSWNNRELDPCLLWATGNKPTQTEDFTDGTSLGLLEGLHLLQGWSGGYFLGSFVALPSFPSLERCSWEMVMGKGKGAPLASSAPCGEGWLVSPTPPPPTPRVCVRGAHGWGGRSTQASFPPLPLSHSLLSLLTFCPAQEGGGNN